MARYGWIAKLTAVLCCVLGTICGCIGSSSSPLEPSAARPQVTEAVSATSEPPETAMPRRDAEQGSFYVRQEDGSTGVIIFVHGFTGDSRKTWTNTETGAYWPELLVQDSEFDHYDIFVVEYPTAHLQSGFSIDELPEVLRREFTTHNILSHKDIVFVAHSMGGIVTRSYINRYESDLAGKVSMIYFFATPTNGAHIANLARAFTMNPQIRQLATDSNWLRSEYLSWLADNHDEDIDSYCGYENLPTRGVGIIVDDTSARALCNQWIDPIQSNHIDIVKPRGLNDERHEAFRNAFRESHAQPLPMPDGFNIAFAEFQVLRAEDSSMTTAVDGHAIAATAAAFMSDRQIVQGIQLAVGNSVHILGPDDGIGPIEDGTADITAYALNADILLYGNLIEQSDHMSEVVPYFYVTERAIARAPELLGEFALGAPIRYRPANPASTKDFNSTLNERLQTLAQLIIGFGYHDYGDLDGYVKAADAYRTAAEAGWDTHSDIAGLEVMYLFLGIAYQRQADMYPFSDEGIEEKKRLLCVAEQAYLDGLTVNEAYGRLENGLGSTYVEMARLGSNPQEVCPEYTKMVQEFSCESTWDCTWNECALDAAEQQYQSALEVSGQIQATEDLVRLVGHLGLGQVNFHRAMCQVPDTSEYVSFMNASRTNHETVLRLYEHMNSGARPSFIAEYAILAHHDLGFFALRSGLRQSDQDDTRGLAKSISHFEQAIDLSLELNTEIHRTFARNLTPYLLVALCASDKAVQTHSRLDKLVGYFANPDEIADSVMNDTQAIADFVRLEATIPIPEDCINDIRN